MRSLDVFTRVARDFNELAAGGSANAADRIQLFGDLAFMFGLLAQAQMTQTVAVNYTATDSDGTIRVNAAGGARTIALPPAALMIGVVLRVKKVDASANVVTVDANGAELIDGVLTKALAAQYQSITIQSNGTSWDVL